MCSYTSHYEYESGSGFYHHVWYISIFELIVVRKLNACIIGLILYLCSPFIERAQKKNCSKQLTVDVKLLAALKSVGIMQLTDSSIKT